MNTSGRFARNVPSPSEEHPTDQPWEFCTVVWLPAKLDRLTEAFANLFLYQPGRFAARSEVGTPTILLAETPYFRGLPIAPYGAAPFFDELVAKLKDQGWEQLPDHGPEWYNLRFRRPRVGAA